MSYLGKTIIAILVWALPLSVSFSEEAGMGNSYSIDLMPLNHSGVYAAVELTLTAGNTLHVAIEAEGLEPGKPHPQHIHGFDKPVRNAACPTPENDNNGDGIITIVEGVSAFGPIILPLVPFDLVDASGRLQYEASFTINPDKLRPLHKRTIVLHGMTVNNEYIPSLPVACGEIVEKISY